MMDYLSVDKNFNLLSIRDLLEARDQYHVHLMHKENVVATAVGRYRIRMTDPWPTSKDHNPKPRTTKGARRIDNSEVRPYSWPCVLVFVKKWAEPSEFGEKAHYHIDDLVPRSLYLPDGRVIPVCVIEAPRYPYALDGAQEPVFPLNNIGGGFPILTEVQGEEHVASISCLVTDGHKTYALTNRHVCGDPGETLHSRLTGKKVPIGVSSPKQLTRLPFQQVYADWPGKNVYVNLDVGLIDINDLNLWTAKVQGIGEVGEIADLSINNISLRLIGCPVRAFGCSSGEIKGEIHGLFYRYKSIGGFEYVADFLIGQRTPKMVKGKREEAVPFATHPGDSGTLYLIDMQPEKGKPLPLPKPLAVQWGGHVFSDATGAPARSFALATCLSTICNLLEVDLIRDWNLDQVEYWGAVGHYSIAANVANAISVDHPKLKQLMTNNREIISYKDDTLLHSEFERQTTAPFVPMADVPDNVWKHGKQGYSRPHEGPNHFADMDQPSTQFHGTLLKYCEDPSNIDPQKWDAFYDSILDPGNGKRISYEHRGLLPFRVRQIFEEMIRFVHQKKFDEFICAAGVLTHYVGDACQPLHISYLHHGDPEDSIIKGKKKIPRAEAVHETYEAAMVNGNREAILKGLAKAPKVKPSELLQTPQEAAEATVDLMRRTFKAIPPPKIVAAQLAGRDGHSSIPKAFWAKFGKQTIKVMQDGTHLLAVLWESAWALGNGEQNVTKLGALTEKRASGIYQREDFLPSFYISEI